MTVARWLLTLSCAIAMSLYLIACSHGQHPSTPTVTTDVPQPAQILPSWPELVGMSDAEFGRVYFTAYPTIDDEKRSDRGSGGLNRELAARSKLRLEALLMDTPEGMRLELLSASDGLMVLYISGLHHVELPPE